MITRLKKKEPKILWVDPSCFHLTVSFPGSVTEGQIAKIISSLRFITKNEKSFTMSFGGAGFSPDTLSPNVVWLRGHNNLELASLVRDINYQLHLHGFEKREKNFIPHFTLGRIKEASVKIKVEYVSREINKFPLSAFLVDHIDLWKLTLSPEKTSTEDCIGCP